MFRRLLFLFALAIPALAQTTLQTTFDTALGTTPTLTDVQLSGNAAWHMGSDEDSGQVVLKARRDGKSRIDLQLGSGTRSEIQINDKLEPQTFVYNGSAWKQSAVHNSWVDANWFFPAFSTAATASERDFVLSSANSRSVRAQFNVGGQKPNMTKLINILSITDTDFDPATSLLTKMRWVTHPDDDLNVSIPVEVRYADYRDVKGVKVPFHIQRYFNGTLQLDITIDSVVINPGLSVSDFTPVAN